MTTNVPLEDALDMDQLRTVASQLKHLPDPDQFKTAVESDLWAHFVPTNKQETTEIAYEEMTSKGQGVIGYIQSEDGETAIPWWLTEFKWDATTIGEDSLTLDSVDNLNHFENFIIDETTIEKPELLHQRRGVSNDLCGALENFDQIYSELTNYIDVSKKTKPEVRLTLPDQIFKVAEGQVQTTEEFQTWVQSVVQLCPPFNKSLTALLMVLSKVDVDVARGVLSDHVTTNLEAIGAFGETLVYNVNYFDPLASSGNSLLTYNWSMFDIQLPYVNNGYDYLAPLEAAFYENWVEENTTFIEQHKDWFILSGRSPKKVENNPFFGQVGLRSPIVQKGGLATYCTLSLRKNGRFSTSSTEEGKRRELNQLLEKYGVTENDTG